MNIIEEKLQDKKPLIVDFGSDTCIPCKMIKPVLEEIAEEYKGTLNVMVLNIHDYKEIASELGVLSIPTQFFYNSEGKLIGQHTGFLPKEEFQKIIKEHLNL